MVLPKEEAGYLAFVTSKFGTSYEPGPGEFSYLNDLFVPMVKAFDLA
jgi:hypothetical protein